MCSTPEEYGEVVQAVASGILNPQDLITGRIPLERTHKDGFLELMNNKDKHIKILVSPTLVR
jgi:(R,R)-butanediol dehydrogenase / meso-butanediol dehydrogenase / diacetyl reductase